jgi:2-methylcitrate dehydratase PrpD
MDLGLNHRLNTAAGGIARSVLCAGSFDIETISKAKLCLIDYLSCAFEARDLPWAEQAAAIATQSSGNAGLIGRAEKVSVAEAGFANAVAGHGLVREDMHTGSIAHLGVVVWPALLALANRQRVSGAALLEAAIVGYEVGARLGRSLISAELARLFRPTGLVGPVAAAMAASRLQGLSVEQALNAFSLAANTSSGLNQWPHNGGSEMYFHPGFAVRNGLIAVELAKAGAIASPDILEGEAGIFRAFARRPMDGEITLFPEGQADILSVFNKAVPACNFAQTPCQAALAANNKRRGQEVIAIHITASEAALRYPGCNSAGPFRYPLQAKMSILFGVAATIARGQIAESNYSELDDPQIDRLIGVTTLVADPQFTSAFPARQGATVTLQLADGTRVSGELEDVEAASSALIEQRFLQSAGTVLGADRADELLSAIHGLDREKDAGRIERLAASLPSKDASPGSAA